MRMIRLTNAAPTPSRGFEWHGERLNMSFEDHFMYLDSDRIIGIEPGVLATGDEARPITNVIFDAQGGPVNVMVSEPASHVLALAGIDVYTGPNDFEDIAGEVVRAVLSELERAEQNWRPSTTFREDLEEVVRRKLYGDV